MANNTENIRRLLPLPKRPPGQPPNPNAQKKLSTSSPSPDNISQQQGGNDAAAAADTAAAEACWSKQDLAYLAAQVRAAREDAHRRRPGNIAQRWSRPVTGYLLPDRRRAYFAAPLYVVDRRGQVGEGGGADAGGQSGRTYGDFDVQMDMEAVDGDGDTVMCCCGCDDVGDDDYGGGGGGGGGQGGEVCRFRRLLCDLGEEWAVGGDEAEVEFMEEEVDLLVRAMRESHVSDAGVKALFERKAGHGLDRVARQ
ncbi:hypothetical protein VPNG_08406 [Cytospora leucostoma]|uniref:Uncharacterized protein n=1 Tax=Cytospora leucostoma TaxID=1230097 RepID=A0A423W5Z6_9PEZI|nr:hypothetical protein VPNG_08406 [Cytospora leucostoma]